MLRLLFGLIILLTGHFTMAAPQAFPPTDVGVSELKTLPAGVLLKAQGTGNYFEQSNRLFRPLFNYISSHDIAMTTPVEAQIENAAMYFWVAASERGKVAGNRGGVDVIEIPERRVASRGARGGYSAENFAMVRGELLAWLQSRVEVVPAGDPYAVYWHGPFMPGFLKRFDVHVPVKPVTSPVKDDRIRNAVTPST